MTQEEILKRFTYHKPIGNQPLRYEALRNKAKELAQMANQICPESREKSNGMTQLEDSVMWFNAAIARNENESTSTVSTDVSNRRVAVVAEMNNWLQEVYGVAPNAQQLAAIDKMLAPLCA